MAVIRTQALPLADYATGTTVLGPANIQNSMNKIGLELDRCTTADPTIWPNESTTIHVTIEISVQNGPYTIEGEFTAQGGIYSERFGEVAKTSMMVPLPAGNNRKVRGTITITNGPLRTRGFVLVE